MLLCNDVISKQAKRAGLAVQGTYGFGEDYARTCAIWAGTLEEKASRIKRLGFDERFMRNWRYYLGVCAASFAVGRTDVVQVELAHA